MAQVLPPAPTQVGLTRSGRGLEDSEVEGDWDLARFVFAASSALRTSFEKASDLSSVHV